MDKVIQLKPKRNRLNDRYLLLRQDEIPQDYTLLPIEHRKEEIDNIPVIVIHRLLVKYYGDPSVIEVRDEELNHILSQPPILKREEQGAFKFMFQCKNSEEKQRLEEFLSNKRDWYFTVAKEWRYWLQTKSGTIIWIGTRKKTNFISVCCVCDLHDGNINPSTAEECSEFINDLLLEQSKFRGELYDFGHSSSRSFSLDNIYLFNYNSALYMLKTGDEIEPIINENFLRYDAETASTEEQDHIHKYMMLLGVYYTSAISYFYMSLEGFINIIYCALLRREYVMAGLNIEQRFDIEQKYRLVGAMCDGFEAQSYDANSVVFDSLKKLTQFRNKLFHSKIDDNMQSILLYEPPFFYNVDLSKVEDDYPSRRFNVKQNHVLYVRNVVDSLIAYVINSLDEKYRNWVNKYVMTDLFIPFIKTSTGQGSFDFSLRAGETSLIKREE